MTLETYRTSILQRFGPHDILNSVVDDLKENEWRSLEEEVREWWRLYKLWEADDTIPKAFTEQRLTVKGTAFSWEKDISALMQTNAQPRRLAAVSSTYAKPREQAQGIKAAYVAKMTPPNYKLKKGLLGIQDRINPLTFVPEGRGESQKTELGAHDLSAGLMHPRKGISDQQYKTPGPDEYFVFMPLSYHGDQAVFQNVNRLVKAYKEQHMEFYNFMRDVRSKMTRVKLAAEHDMSTNFVCIGHTAINRPRFRFTLVSKTDVSRKDAPQLAPNAKFEKETDKVTQVRTTTGLMEARRLAAINFQSLVLGAIHGYGEVTVAYRQHAGGFPKFCQWDDNRKLWKVGNVVGNKWEFNNPEVTIADKPLL
jgi:hypothetical protein